MQDPYVAVAAVQARAPVWLLAQARIEGRKKSDFRTTDFSMTDQLCAFSALKTVLICLQSCSIRSASQFRCAGRCRPNVRAGHFDFTLRGRALASSTTRAIGA